MLYNSLIYPFFTYGIHVWGLTYPTYLKPLTTLQKRLVRIMTFSEPVRITFRTLAQIPKSFKIL